MLVAQAVSASEFFLGVKYESELTDRIYRDILSEKTNIVLVGMPGSGKTTAGKPSPRSWDANSSTWTR